MGLHDESDSDFPCSWRRLQHREEAARSAGCKCRTSAIHCLCGTLAISRLTLGSISAGGAIRLEGVADLITAVTEGFHADARRARLTDRCKGGLGTTPPGPDVIVVVSASPAFALIFAGAGLSIFQESPMHGLAGIPELRIRSLHGLAAHGAQPVETGRYQIAPELGDETCQRFLVVLGSITRGDAAFEIGPQRRASRELGGTAAPVDQGAIFPRVLRVPSTAAK